MEEPGNPDDRLGQALSDDPLEAMVACVTDGLAGYVTDEAGLWDPLLNRPSPTGHYGQLAACLAFVVAGREHKAEQAKTFAARQATPDDQLDHAPFNRFLLLLLRHQTGSDLDSFLIDSELRRCPLGKRYPSNNWGLLGQCCRVIEAPSSNMRKWEADQFCRMLDAWCTPAGGFIDYPNRPRKQVATPVTYHCKALFLTVIVAWFHDFPGIGERVQRLIRWIGIVWDGGGYIGGFGRSTHALYGDACLLAALVLLGATSRPGNSTPLARLLDGVRQRLTRQVREDDLLWLNPAGARSCDESWDDYMVLSVYNAWLAGVVGWAYKRFYQASGLPECLQRVTFPAAADGLSQDEHAGLVRLRTPVGLTALMSTKGQPPQGFSRSHAELRYAGGVPFHFALGSQPICPPATRVAVDELLQTPALAGWTPVFLSGGRLYGLVYFPGVQVHYDTEGTEIVLHGSPVALNDRIISTVNRVRSALDWRYFNGSLGRHQALYRPKCSGVTGCIKFRLVKRQVLLDVRLTLDVDPDCGFSGIRYLNPCGHALFEGQQPLRKTLDVKVPGSSGDVSRAQSWHDQQSVRGLPTALAAGFGYCLPSLQLQSGRTHCQIRLVWDPSSGGS